jgi:hypothetical protein
MFAATVVLIWGTRRASLGIALGALLAWVNYVWLKQIADALARAAVAQEGETQARVPARVYLKFAARLVLTGLMLYLSVYRFKVPATAIVCGLLALGAAALVESIYEVIRGVE